MTTRFRSLLRPLSSFTSPKPLPAPSPALSTPETSSLLSLSSSLFSSPSPSPSPFLRFYSSEAPPSAPVPTVSSCGRLIPVATTRVEWGHMDAYNHVNNVQYFKYFETARILYFDKVAEQCTDHHLRNNLFSGAGYGMILKSTGCTYKFPLTYPDEIVVYAGLTKVQKDRYEADYEVYSKRHGVVAAVGTSEMVSYDYASLKKAPIPEELLEAMRKVAPKAEFLV